MGPKATCNSSAISQVRHLTLTKRPRPCLDHIHIYQSLTAVIVNNADSYYVWTPLDFNLPGNYSLEIFQSGFSDISPRFELQTKVARPPPTSGPMSLDPNSGAVYIE